ncbi:MAG: AI-2E family transporter [Flexilinea sp.]|nr:AI-2E family transporter [Flexilinea sp.]
MSKLKQYLDKRYTKVSLYVIGTIIVTFFLCILISMSGGFFENLFHVIGLVLKPFIAGGIIAYLFEPLVQWIEKGLKIKAARPIAVFGTLILIILLVISLLFMAFAFLSNQVQEIHFEDIGNLIGDFSVQLNDIWAKAQEWFASHDINIGKITGGVSGFISGLTGAATDILFAVIFSIYFMLDSNAITGYWNRVRGIFIKPETRAKVHEILMDADKCFSGYIRGQFLDALLVGVVAFIAMALCRVPYPFVIGLLTGLGNLIPYVGPVVGFATLVIVCLIEGVWGKLLVGGIVLAVIMVLDGNLINPKLLSSSIEIHPLLVFAAMTAGSAVGGLLGMLVAVPLAALLKIEFDKYIDKKEKEKKS